jgi:hypothetical protein
LLDEGSGALAAIPCQGASCEQIVDGVNTIGPGGVVKGASAVGAWLVRAGAWILEKVGVRAAAKTGAMAGRRLGHTFTKHGAENTAQLLKEAAGSGKPVGQWLDNARAEQFIADRLGQLKDGARTFDLPKGLGRVVNPDGTFSAATKARLVPSGSGVKTAFPLIE